MLTILYSLPLIDCLWVVSVYFTVPGLHNIIYQSVLLRKNLFFSAFLSPTRSVETDLVTLTVCGTDIIYYFSKWVSLYKHNRRMWWLINPALLFSSPYYCNQTPRQEAEPEVSLSLVSESRLIISIDDQTSFQLIPTSEMLRPRSQYNKERQHSSTATSLTWPIKP